MNRSWISDRSMKVSVCVLIALMVSASVPRAAGEAGSVVYTFGSTLSQNQSNYTLYYSIPQVIQTGAKTNMTFYIYLTELSGWKIQSQRQVLQIIINTPAKSVTTQEVQNSVTLYQGARWGPFNMTIDLNDSQVGLKPGQMTNATVFADLVVYEAYDNPLYPFVQDDGATFRLADVQILASPDGQGLLGGRLLTSLAVGAAVVAGLTAIAVVVRRRAESGSSGRTPVRGPEG